MPTAGPQRAGRRHRGRGGPHRPRPPPPPSPRRTNHAREETPVDADRLTTKSQEAVSTAVRTAAASGHPEVAPVHLLLALLDQGDGITRPLLLAVGADPKTVRTRAGALPAAPP